MILRIVVLLALCGLVLMGATAQAQDNCTFDVTSGDWDVTGNWDCGAGGAHVPGAADRAIIPISKTCNIDSVEAADSLSVAGTLNIVGTGATTNSLTVDGHDNGSTIAGTINLQGSNSVLAFTTNDQTIDGAGKIVGQNNAATISITFGETLTNDTTIQGNLQIIGAGDFVNSGTVHANVSGILLIDCNSFDDLAGAEWKISTSSTAVMQFAVTSTALAATVGDWTITNGKLDVDSEGFRSTGSLVWEGGVIDVAAGSVADFGVVVPSP